MPLPDCFEGVLHLHDNAAMLNGIQMVSHRLVLLTQVRAAAKEQ